MSGARKVTVAATQMACTWDREANLARGERLVREAASRGANVILLQELFETPYFCKDHQAKYFELAQPIAGHPTIERFARLARELGVVLPLSVFERANNAAFGVLGSYTALVPSFERLYEREGRDFRRFYAEVQRIAALPAGGRRAALER